MRACHGRKDAVMQIELHHEHGMSHRRYFMTPFVVVAAIVFVELDHFPTATGQSGQGIGQMNPRDKNIQVRRQPSGSNRQILADVGGPFEQYARVWSLAQHRGYTFQCPQHGRRSPARQAMFGNQMASWLRRYAAHQAGCRQALGQARKQAQPPRQSEHSLPLGEWPAQGQVRLTQRLQPSQSWRSSLGIWIHDLAAAWRSITCGQTVPMVASASSRSL